MDATSDRDFAIEFTQCLCTLGLHISRFAEEITLYSTAEFGFIELPERFSTGSSAMPQKKNPDLTELLRGKCGRLAGAAITLTTMVKGLPLAYNKDLQEGQEPVFDAADTIAGILQRVAILHKSTQVPPGHDETCGNVWLSKRNGRCNLSHAQRCSLPKSTRDRRKRCSLCP